MITYRKIKITGNILIDWFVSWYNLLLMRRVIIKIATNEHKKTGRQVHVSEMFGSFIIFDSRDRQDLNKSGKVNQMNVYEAMRASIWNSNQLKLKSNGKEGS